MEKYIFRDAAPEGYPPHYPMVVDMAYGIAIAVQTSLQFGFELGPISDFPVFESKLLRVEMEEIDENHRLNASVLFKDELLLKLVLEHKGDRCFINSVKAIYKLRTWELNWEVDKDSTQIEKEFTYDELRLIKNTPAYSWRSEVFVQKDKSELNNE